MLAKLNPYPRDANITFKDEDHSYSIKGVEKKPTSVTTLIHKFFPQFIDDVVIAKMMASINWPKSKYFGRTAEDIKNEWKVNSERASSEGTKMHKNIENFFNNEPLSHEGGKEFKMFMNFWNDIQRQYPGLRVRRTEPLVYDEDVGIAGSIDLVLEDEYGNTYIFDWKRSKDIKFENKFEKGFPPFEKYDNCNFSHYTLQLNFYRHILETKYQAKVVFMMLIILHPDQDNYQCHVIPRVELNHIWHTLNK